MSSYCGIFWDIQNIDIPKKSSAESIFYSIEENILDPFGLVLKEFFVVGGFNTITIETVKQLRQLGATFEEAGPGKNAADKKIKNRMLKFIDRCKQRCTIILITGDSGIGKPLSQFRQNPLFKIFCVRLKESFGDQLGLLADRVFILTPNSPDGVLMRKYIPECFIPEIRAYNSPYEFGIKYFLQITRDQFYDSNLIGEIKDDLSSYGATFEVVFSADEIWCVFDEVADAKLALERKNGHLHKYSKSKSNGDSFCSIVTQIAFGLLCLFLWIFILSILYP